MKSPIRLLAAVAPDGESIDFDALFAVPAADQPEVCAPAELQAGDGEVIELGLLCSPTPFTWRSQQRVKLASHRYRDDGAHTASLHWGEVTAEVTVAPEMFARDIAGQPAIERPTVTLFAVNAVADSPHERRARLEVAGLVAEPTRAAGWRRGPGFLALARRNPQPRRRVAVGLPQAGQLHGCR